MSYTTQMDAARQGILTREMEAVAKKEQFAPEELMKLVAEGKVAIPANRLHTCLEPNGIGSMLKTKINVNLGTSRDCKDLDMELSKVNRAVEMGAESIMDLSSWGDTRTFRRKLTAEVPGHHRDSAHLRRRGLLPQAPEGRSPRRSGCRSWRCTPRTGWTFMTIHVGINRRTAERFKQAKRLTNIVSRGGSIIFAWMEMTGEENPFYAQFDRILDICREYDVTLSLGGRLPARLPGGRLGHFPDRGAGDPGRADGQGLGEGCAGDHRGAGTHALRSDRRQHEAAADPSARERPSTCWGRW